MTPPPAAEPRAEDNRSPGTRTWVPELAALGVAAAFLAGSLTWVLTTHRIPDSSDQAVVGLMALHILHGQGHPVFYFGSTYAGSLEAHFLAVVFFVFGASSAVYRSASTFLVLLIVAGVWRLTRQAFGARSAMFAVAYLALPPFFFLYKGLTSDGHYAAAQLIAIGLFASALWQHERSTGTNVSLLPLCAVGFLAGLGLWVSPISPPVSAAVGLWLLVYGYVRPFVRGTLCLAGGAIVGSLPWWLWNVRHGWASVSSPDVGLQGGMALLSNLANVARYSLAVLMGAGRPLVRNDPGSPYPGAWPLVGLLLLLILVPLLASDVRTDRRIHLFLLAAVFVVVAGAASRRLEPREPRFFVTLYVIVTPLLGVALARALSFRRWAVVAMAAFVGILATNAGSLAAARTHRTVQQELEVTGSIQDLLETLRSKKINRIYANYWTAYRVAFESREEIIATPLREDDAVRIDGYEKAVNGSEEPAFVLLPPTSTCFEHYLNENGLPFQKSLAGAFAVFSAVPRDTLLLVRSARSLPLPSEGHAASWKTLLHPASIGAGRKADVAFEIRNLGPCAWTSATHLGHRWLRADPPGDAIEAPERFFPSGRTAPGASFRAEFPVRAPVEPGRYVLEYDLVQEGVSWFNGKGSSPAHQPVVVTR